VSGLEAAETRVDGAEGADGIASSDEAAAAESADVLADRVFWAALAARMAVSSASGTPALRAAMSLRTSGTSTVSAPRKSVIRREKRISWGASGADAVAGAASTLTSGTGCGIGVGTTSADVSGTLKEVVWCVVEATTGLTEALAGVAAEVRLLRRPSDREADWEAGADADLASAA